MRAFGAEGGQETFTELRAVEEGIKGTDQPAVLRGGLEAALLRPGDEVGRHLVVELVLVTVEFVGLEQGQASAEGVFVCGHGV